MIMMAKSKFMAVVKRKRASKVKQSYKITRKRMKSIEEWQKELQEYDIVGMTHGHTEHGKFRSTPTTLGFLVLWLDFVLDANPRTREERQEVEERLSEFNIAWTVANWDRKQKKQRLENLAAAHKNESEAKSSPFLRGLKRFLDQVLVGPISRILG